MGPARSRVEVPRPASRCSSGTGRGASPATAASTGCSWTAAAVPPMPWSNVIANPRFGCLVTESGGGLTRWPERCRRRTRTKPAGGLDRAAVIEPPAGADLPASRRDVRRPAGPADVPARAPRTAVEVHHGPRVISRRFRVLTPRPRARACRLRIRSPLMAGEVHLPQALQPVRSPRASFRSPVTPSSSYRA